MWKQALAGAVFSHFSIKTPQDFADSGGTRYVPAALCMTGSQRSCHILNIC
jgi:hypothetical protein